MNKISIIVPVYNVEKYVAECLDSILDQNHRNIEVIIVNDGSTDASGKIVEEYAAKDSRIKVIHKENGGLSDARNSGYQLVTGDYIAFVDSDDIISKHFCEKLLLTIQKHDADIVECNFVKFTNVEDFSELEFGNEEEEYDAERGLEFLMKEHLKQVVWNKLYKTKLVNNLPFEKGKIHEDEFWTYQIFGKARKIVKITEPLYFYRQQNESIMAESYNIKRLHGLEAREKRMHYIQSKFPKIANLAVQTFWYSAFNNFQAIERTPGIDNDKQHRNTILEKIKKNVTQQYYSQWTTKDVHWLKFFLAAPRWCSRLRNFFGVGC